MSKLRALWSVLRGHQTAFRLGPPLDWRMGIPANVPASVALTTVDCHLSVDIQEPVEISFTNCRWVLKNGEEIPIPDGKWLVDPSREPSEWMQGSG